jgi:VanZ family protein
MMIIHGRMRRANPRRGPEMSQAWMPQGRDGEPLDVVADLVGLLLALALASALGRGRSRQTS